MGSKVAIPASVNDDYFKNTSKTNGKNEEEFFNTYTDGREIVIKIGVENEMDLPEAKNFRFIHESPATLAFPRGVIYHINAVVPPEAHVMRGQDAP